MGRRQRRRSGGEVHRLSGRRRPAGRGQHLRPAPFSRARSLEQRRRARLCRGESQTHRGLLARHGLVPGRQLCPALVLRRQHAVVQQGDLRSGRARSGAAAAHDAGDVRVWPHDPRTYGEVRRVLAPAPVSGSAALVDPAPGERLALVRRRAPPHDDQPGRIPRRLPGLGRSLPERRSTTRSPGRGASRRSQLVHRRSRRHAALLRWLDHALFRPLIRGQSWHGAHAPWGVGQGSGQQSGPRRAQGLAPRGAGHRLRPVRHQ